MIAGVLALLRALPELIGLFKQLVGAVGEFVEAHKNAQREEWISKQNQLALEIKELRNDEDRARYAELLANQRAHMPR